MFQDDSSMHESRETIYTARYALPRLKRRAELLATLRQGSKVPLCSHGGGADRRGEISNMVRIHLRPPEVDDRVILGHCEGDLIRGKVNTLAVGTLVMPTSLLINLDKVADSGAQASIDSFTVLRDPIESQRLLSRIYYHGREMSLHVKLPDRTGVKVYITDPTARGSEGSMRTQTDFAPVFTQDDRPLHVHSR